MTTMLRHAHPLAAPRNPDAMPDLTGPTPIHGPDREATFRELCRAISEALPVPQVTSIPPGSAGDVQLVVADPAAVDMWAGWLGARTPTDKARPNEGVRVYRTCLNGWLGWSRIVVTAHSQNGPSVPQGRAA